MIRIKKNEDIDLNIPKFLCDDNAVGEHLNNHDLTKLLNVFGFLCVVGRPGTGKTSLTISLITQNKPKIYKKTSHHVIVIMPQNSINSMTKNPFKGLENAYHEINNDIICEIYDKIDGWSKDDEKTLLYIDDMTADLKRTKLIQETLKKMIYNRRHLKLNLIITVQSYVNIPLDIRKNIQNCIMLKPSKREMELLFTELIEQKKELFLDIMKVVYTEPHNFLFVNIPNQRLFKNWDELIIMDSGEENIIP